MKHSELKSIVRAPGTTSSLFLADGKRVYAEVGDHIGGNNPEGMRTEY